jgi:hypothetical protein
MENEVRAMVRIVLPDVVVLNKHGKQRRITERPGMADTLAAQIGQRPNPSC